MGIGIWKTFKSAETTNNFIKNAMLELSLPQDSSLRSTEADSLKMVASMKEEVLRYQRDADILRTMCQQYQIEVQEATTEVDKKTAEIEELREQLGKIEEIQNQQMMRVEDERMKTERDFLEYKKVTSTELKIREIVTKKYKETSKKLRKAIAAKEFRATGISGDKRTVFDAVDDETAKNNGEGEFEETNLANLLNETRLLDQISELNATNKLNLNSVLEDLMSGTNFGNKSKE